MYKMIEIVAIIHLYKVELALVKTYKMQIHR